MQIEGDEIEKKDVEDDAIASTAEAEANAVADKDEPKKQSKQVSSGRGDSG